MAHNTTAWAAVCVLMGLCLLLNKDAAASSPESAKRFIELGWDIPTTSYLRDNWQTMEQTTPFDGVIYQVSVEEDGRDYSTQSFWDRSPWRREWLAQPLGDLKSCHFTQFQSNFVRINATPGDLDWFDDQAWTVLAEKTEHIGWLVKESGSAGICLDFESYGKPQFRYDPTRRRSFRETAARARQRGAQFMQALARECPTAVVLTLWLNSVNFGAGESTDPAMLLAGGGYGLLPGFVDGMLDAMPPGMTLVDGCESAYLFDGEVPYLQAYNKMRQVEGPAARLVSPENLGKYRAQVQAGFGFYLDAYYNPETSFWYIGGHGGPRLARLQYNLAIAREVCDRYVWVYGEQFRWWPRNPGDWRQPAASPAPNTGRSWEEAMPGITRAIRWARDPMAAALAELAQRRASGALENLAVNPGFEDGVGEEGLPRGYTSWQAEGSNGTFSLDSTRGHRSQSTAKASHVREGCLIQSHPVEPGQVYGVEAEFLVEGNSACHILIRWQDKDGKWARQDQDHHLRPITEEGQWRRAFAAVQVPEGAGRLIILLCAGNQVSEEDACWFDNLGLYRF